MLVGECRRFFPPLASLYPFDYVLLRYPAARANCRIMRINPSSATPVHCDLQYVFDT